MRAALLLLAACGAPPADTGVDSGAPLVLPVDDFATEGHTVSAFIQGNSDFVVGAEVCFEGDCATTGADGRAALSGLPDGPVALTVDGGAGVPLLLPLTLRADHMPRVAARSLTRGIYDSWITPRAWPSGTGLIQLSVMDLSSSDPAQVAGVEVRSSDGEVWIVDDWASARPGDTSSGTGPVWIAGVQPGEVTLTIDFPDGLCAARDQGWDGPPAAPGPFELVVPAEADRATSLYLHCVALD